MSETISDAIVSLRSLAIWHHFFDPQELWGIAVWAGGSATDVNSFPGHLLSAADLWQLPKCDPFHLTPLPLSNGTLWGREVADRSSAPELRDENHSSPVTQCVSWEALSTSDHCKWNYLLWESSLGTVVCSGAPGGASLGFPRWFGPQESKGLRKLNLGVCLSAFKMHMPWGQSLCRYYPAVRSEKHLENRLLLPELTTWLKPTCRLTTAETKTSQPCNLSEAYTHPRAPPPRQLLTGAPLSRSLLLKELKLKALCELSSCLLPPPEPSPRSVPFLASRGHQSLHIARRGLLETKELDFGCQFVLTLCKVCFKQRGHIQTRIGMRVFWLFCY